MYRILFFIPLHIIGLPDVPVYSYGAMLTTGFLAAIMLIIRLGRRDGLTADHVYSISVPGFSFFLTYRLIAI